MSTPRNNDNEAIAAAVDRLGLWLYDNRGGRFGALEKVAIEIEKHNYLLERIATALERIAEQVVDG